MHTALFDVLEKDSILLNYICYYDEHLLTLVTRSSVVKQFVQAFIQSDFGCVCQVLTKVFLGDHFVLTQHHQCTSPDEVYNKIVWRLCL